MSVLSKADLLLSYADNIIGAVRALTHRNFVDSVLGGLASLLVIGGGTSQTVTTTPTKMTGWAADGLEVGCSADYTVNELTADVDGIYRVDIDLCFSGSNSGEYLAAIYIDNGSGFVDAGLPRIHRKLGTGGDVGSSHQHGNVNLGATDKLAVYIWALSGTVFVPTECTFSMKRVG